VRRSTTSFLLVVLVASAAACSGGNSRHAAKPSPSTKPKQHQGKHRAGLRTPVTRPDGGGRTVAAPTSIPSDCSVDVSAELQSWFDGLADHVTAALPDGACYRIEKTLVLARRRDLVIEGNGATLKATTTGVGGRLQQRARSQLSIAHSQNITVRNLTVHGANPRGGANSAAYQPGFEAQHGFSLLADDNVTLDRVHASDVYGDFVYIGGAVKKPCRHITVKNSTFERSGRQGISVTNGEDILIASNHISDVGRSMFDLEPNLRGAEVRRIRIEDNTTGAALNYWIANKGVGINIGDVTVSRNVMKSPTGALVIVVGPKFGKRGPFTFANNDFVTTGAVSDEHAAGAFLFVNVSGVAITGNRLRVTGTAQLAGVEVRTSDHVAVNDNRFTGTTRTMLADSASTNITSPTP
jgi:hypothetical protein